VLDTNLRGAGCTRAAAPALAGGGTSSTSPRCSRRWGCRRLPCVASKGGLVALTRARIELAPSGVA
jgi:hypothetical protein